MLVELKKKLKGTFIYPIYLKIKYIIYPVKLKIGRVNKNKPKYSGIDGTSKKNIIVSLTSFPGRIKLVYKTVYSIMNQTIKPNKIILWLSKKQFPFMDKELPEELLELKKYGLDIEWIDNDIKSYKKLIPTLKKYKEKIIVTADDDIYYPIYWLENLYNSYLEHPKDIHCHLITRLEEGKKGLYVVKRNKKMIGKSSFLNKLVGCGGVLYPPHCLDDEVFNEREFMNIAPTSDDIWFWAMAVIRGTKIRWIRNKMNKIYYTEYSQEKTESLCKVNDDGEHLFNVHLKNIEKKYNLYNIIEKGN